MNIANSVKELDKFLENTIENSSFYIQEVKFNDQRDWVFKEGALSHKTGGFFDVIGLEDSGKEHLILYQPQSALTGLAIHKNQGDIYILLQARIEPGNSGIGQYGPTIQSTPANFFALHGGKKTNALGLFYRYNNSSTSVGTSMQLDLGKRYFHKSKWHNYVLLDDFCKTEGPMIWVNLKTVRERIEKDNYFNADLRSLLAVFNWDKIFEQYCKRIDVFKNDGILRYLLSKRQSFKVDYSLKSLKTFKNIQVTDEGIISNLQNLCIKMFYTSCGTREVSDWYQPLMLSQSNGLVILKIRKVKELYECLLTVSKEIGIDSGYLITATHVFNPGESIPVSIVERNSKILHEFVQSDEGGRFYKHESVYQVHLVDENIKKNENQYWVSLLQLKGIMGMSNIASFQLRCISSILIFRMNDSLRK